MSALTASIGHELAQPLSAMMHNAQAMQMMFAARSASGAPSAGTTRSFPNGAGPGGSASG